MEFDRVGWGGVRWDGVWVEWGAMESSGVE